MSDANRTRNPGIHGSTTGRSAVLWLLGLTVTAVVLLALGGEPLRLTLRYERDAVLQAGQYWRLLSCHFVHGSTTHALLNLAGLVLIAALFPKHYSARAWVTISLSSIGAIAVGFIWNEPQLDWYVGLSGVLHGVLAAGIIAWWRSEPRMLAFALTAIFAGKLAWEQWMGALPLSGDLAVIVDAHLYGAIGGALAGAALQIRDHGWRRIVRPL